MLHWLLAGAWLTGLGICVPLFWGAQNYLFANSHTSVFTSGFSESETGLPEKPLKSAPSLVTLQLGQHPASSQLVIELHGLSQAVLERLAAEPPTSREWAQLFPVLTERAAEETSLTLPALAGSYEIAEDHIRFVPRFPFSPGMTYVVRFNEGRFQSKYGFDAKVEETGGVDKWVQKEFSIPKKASTPTGVQHIYPSADELPVNLLKFYVHFSAPMSLGQAYRNIHLFSESGEEIEGPFLEIEQELWDPLQQRLTLLLDPGRIKRGLQPHADLGLPLRPGKRYRLVISQEWQDAKGQPLKEAYEKIFSVVEADRTAPDHANWRTSSPTAGTLEPLTLTFPEPLDQALLVRLIEVVDSQGHFVEGEVEIVEKETIWHFRPSQIWQAGTYSIQVGTALEDLAGNNLRAVFDVDLENDRPEETDPFVTLPFVIDARD